MSPNKVCLVTAFVPLPVSHLSEAQYRDLGAKLKRAAADHYVAAFEDDQLEQCWLYKTVPDILKYEPAAPVPGDRFATAEINVMSHVIQHNRTTWAMRAAAQFPDADVFVWADYGIIKQGGWNSRPVMEPMITAFLVKVADYHFNDIPFPGIEEPKEIDPYGNNWRFCGSLHIWPRKWLRQIDVAYKAELLNFLGKYNKCPLDLAIWPSVEYNHRYLPFKWYKAEYDSSQFTEFPNA